MDTRVVMLTAPSSEAAETIARTLVEESLAACVNVVPGATSFYRWEGGVREDAEVFLFAKTTSDGFAALSARVLELHPYDVPEVISLDVAEGLPAYVAWVASEVGGA